MNPKGLENLCRSLHDASALLTPLEQRRLTASETKWLRKGGPMSIVTPFCSWYRIEVSGRNGMFLDTMVDLLR